MWTASIRRRMTATLIDGRAIAQQVRAQVAPFDDATVDPWLDRLIALGLDR